MNLFTLIFLILLVMALLGNVAWWMVWVALLCHLVTAVLITVQQKRKMNKLVEEITNRKTK